MRPWLFVRKGEVWLGKLGLFWSREIRGVELPNGKGWWW